MKEKITKFYNSQLFLPLMTLFVLVCWGIPKPLILGGVSLTSVIGMTVLALLAAIGLIFLDNIAPTMFLVLGFVYTFNGRTVNLETMPLWIWGAVVVTIWVVGFAFRMIRTKKFELGALGRGLALIALANFMPLFYTERSFPAFLLTIMSLYPLFMYLIFRNNSQWDLSYLMKVMLYLSIVIGGELIIHYLVAIIKSDDLGSIEHLIRTKWDHINDFGWGKINHGVIELLLLIPAWFYYIFKTNKPHYWLGLASLVFVILLSGSRGGLIGLSVISVLFVIYLAMWGSLDVKLTALIVIPAALLLLVGIGNRFLTAVFDNLFVPERADISSGRYRLWEKAWETFKQYPIFGGGWMSNSINDSEGLRVQFYHSTFFHTIAVMGLFGLFSVIVNWVESLGVIFRKRSIEKYLIFTGFIAAHTYGMLDNTQHHGLFMASSMLILCAAEFFTNESHLKAIPKVQVPFQIN